MRGLVGAVPIIETEYPASNDDIDSKDGLSSHVNWGNSNPIESENYESDISNNDSSDDESDEGLEDKEDNDEDLDIPLYRSHKIRK